MMTFFRTLWIVCILSTIPSLLAATEITTESDSELFAYIGSRYQKVATLFAQKTFSLDRQDDAGETLALAFGNDVGFIAKETVSIQKEAKSAVKTKAVLQGYIITLNPTALYTDFNEHSEQFALIEADLRYPFNARVTDKQGNSWYQVSLADRTGYIKTEDVQPDNGIPIVMYHHVLQDKENRNYRNTPTTVSTDALRLQFETMKTQGFIPIRLSSLEKYLQGKINLPAKTVVLTFDDGLKSVYRYAYPLLKEYGFHATLFVITSRIQAKPQQWAPDTLQFLSTEEYQAMQDRTVLHSHSHSLHHHKNFKPAVLQADYPTMYVDLTLSKQELAKLNAQTVYFAYPFGAYTTEFLSAVKKSGFRLALTTEWGKVKFGDDPLLLKRVYFTSEDSKERIIAILGNEGK